MLLKKAFRGVERIFSEALVPWSENDVSANRVILQCRKTASLFAPAPMRDVTDLPIEA